jgi:hypothetical protein
MSNEALRFTNLIRAGATAIALAAVILCVQAAPVACQSNGQKAGAPERTTAQVSADSAQAIPSPPDSVVAVYYHYTLRCQTCLMMEAAAEEVIKTKFPKELMKGKIRWRHIDFEQPEHAWAEEKYQLSGSTLVLSHWKNKTKVSWAPMDVLWEHCDDPEAVSALVHKQLELCLAGKCDHEASPDPEKSEDSKPKPKGRQI